MSAIGSLSTALAALRENPVILLGALCFIALSQLYVLLTAAVPPLLTWVVYPLWFLAFPFVLGGFIAMIHEGLSGSTAFGTFVRGGREHYVSMLAATLLLTAVFIMLTIVGMILVLVVGLGAVAGGGLAAILAAGAVMLVLVSVAFMFLQFYDAAIVVSDAGAVESLSRSVSLVAGNVVSVVGFSILFFAISWLGQGPGMALYFSAIEITETGETVVASGSMVALSVGVTLVLGTVTLAYAYTYFVTFYSSLVADDADPATAATG